MRVEVAKEHYLAKIAREKAEREAAATGQPVKPFVMVC